MKKLVSCLALSGIFLSSPLYAHFQMLYTPESALTKSEEISLKAVFTHPFADEHTMDMAEPDNFYVVHNGNKTDLKATLSQIIWKGNANEAKAFSTNYKTRGMGDYVFVLEPAPYLEQGEGDGLYIQQFTKMIVNVAGKPTDWDKPLGLKAEIVPLTKPYAIWAGSTFSGIVLSEGKPVADAEIEVEYLNAKVDMTKNAMGKLRYKAPQDSFVTLIVKTDVNGKFTFGIPKAGWWGFSAITVGPDKSFSGKELSQDAVIWVQAKEMTK